MKYTIQFLDKIENIKQFLIVDGVLFLLSDHKLRIIDEILGTKIIDFKSDSIYEVNENIFSARNFYYDTTLKKNIVLEGMKNYYFTNDFYEDNLLFSNLDMVLYSLKDQKILTHLPFNEDYGIYKVLDNKFIGRGDDFYNLFTFNNELLWQHSFSDLLEGEKIVQVGDTIIYKDFLYLCLKDSENEKNNATFCINIETGKVVNMYKGFYGFLFLKDDNIYTSYIYSVKKLSLISGEITEYSFENILKPKDLKIHWDKSTVKDNKLYFVDFKIYSTNRMGIIDMEKYELIWQKDFEINDGINNNIQEIRLVENRLYVHCSDNTLHIFEEG